MRKLLFLFLLLGGMVDSFGALNVMVHDGSASTDFNDSANWTGTMTTGVTFTAGDSALMNTTSGNATAAASPSIGALLVTAGYNGALSYSGQVLTVLNGASFDGTGTLNLGNGVTLSGPTGLLHIGTGVGVLTCASCVLTYSGATAGIIDYDKSSDAKPLNRLVVAANGKVTNTGASRINFSTTGVPITLGGGTKITVTIDINAYKTTGSGYLISTGASDTLNLSGANSEFVLSVAGTAPKDSIGALDIIGAHRFSLNYVADNAKVSLAGNFNGTATSPSRLLIYGGNDLDTFNTNGYALNCDSLLIRSIASDKTIVATFANSVLNVGYWEGGVTAGSMTKFNLGSSTVNVAKDFNAGTKELNTYIVGTSTINKTGATSTKSTPIGNTFYTFNIAKTGNVKDTLAAGDSLKATNMTISGGGMFQYSNSPIILTGNYTRTSTDSNYMRGEKTIVGDMVIGAGAGGNSGGDSTLTIFNGAGNSAMTVNGNRVGRVRLKKSATTATLTLADACTTKTILDSTGTLVLTKYLRADSLLILADSVFATGDTMASNKVVWSTTVKPKLDHSLFYFDLARKDSLWSNSAKSMGNITENKSGDTLSMVGVVHCDTLRITDGGIRISDSVYANVLIWASTDTSTLSSPVVVANKITVAAGAKIGYAGASTGALIMTTCTQATTNGNGVVITYPAECGGGQSSATSNRWNSRQNMNSLIISP